MCGIAGVIKTNSSRVERKLLEQMISMVRYRGPDAVGLHISGAIGLAHSRLSIIDVHGGQQPMHNENGTIWITFNGEIFNFIELRDDLIKKGHRFRTESDTEVILHLYEDSGEACVNALNGQWAFAIWDTTRQKLFLSRDRLGVRPLFYAKTLDSFIFGSEIKSLLVVPTLRRTLDLQALNELFTFWVTLPPRTMFEGVSELPPGHSLVLEGGHLRVEQYWQIDYHPSSDEWKNEEEAREELRRLLMDATRIRLRSDVPVGAYLSGGLDSTVIGALMSRLGATGLKTFSIAFESREYDESRFQAEASAFLKTDHHRIVTSHQDIGRVFPEVIWHTEKPLLRTAPAPLFLLSKLVREEGYKVILSGEGADEMMGGYDIFKEAKVRRFMAKFPDSRFRPNLLRRLYPYMKAIQCQSDAYLQAFFRVKKENIGSPLFSHLPRWEMTTKLKQFFSNEVTRIIGQDNALCTLEDRLPQRYEEWDSFAQSQYLESAYLLPGYILSSQGDRMAMAHSVEGRFPFLDYRIVEFASRLPSKFKMKVLNEKYLLKEAVIDLIPEAIRNRHKQPYRAPDSQSFFAGPKEGRLFEYVEDLLSPQSIQAGGLFDCGAVGKLLVKARQGQIVSVKDNMSLVGILSTQLVVDQFIKNFPRSL